MKSMMKSISYSFSKLRFAKIISVRNENEIVGSIHIEIRHAYCTGILQECC